MKGTIRYCLLALAVFLIISSTSLALVGDLNDPDLYIQPDQELSGTAIENSAERSASIERTGPVGAYIPYQENPSTQAPYQKGYPEGSARPSQSSSVSSPSSSSQASLYRAPWIGGPAEDRLTAELIGLSIPQAESYAPDESLNFVSYPMSMMTASADYGQEGSAMSGFEAGSSLDKTTSTIPGSTSSLAGSTEWYYPGLVRSSNRFYVQTASGLGTVAGCSYKGYLPLWAEIKSKGNFFVYEWYPEATTPLVRSWGWSGPGYKKGWFTGDVPGWHIICYHCGDWSNYIYIYVYPSIYSSTPSSSSSSSGYMAGERAAIQPSLPSTMSSTIPASPSTIPSLKPSVLPYTGQSYGQPTMQPTMQPSRITSLPAGAPTPPDIYSEQLAIPDFNMYPPATGQAGSLSYYGGSSPKNMAPSAIAISPPQGYPKEGNGMVKSTAPAASSTSARTTTTCTTSTLISEGVYGICPYVDDSGCCQDDKISKGLEGPSKYASPSSKAVFPKPSKCRCNEYYVPSCKGDIDTVAGVYCDEWLALWSKISRSGEYWSYEWKVCHSSSSKDCNPEVKNFGYKNAGWYQTWFRGSEPGWHILSYHCGDWSNYVYIYVWPAD